MIVRHDGFKVFPSLIESVVSTHPEVKQCCAVGIKDDKQVQGKLPVVFVVPKSQNASLDELRLKLEELCRKELPEYAQPIRWHFQEKLQLTAIGKVDYRTLEKMAEEVIHG